MTQKTWLIDVLHDMVEFARMNDMPVSARVLRDAAEMLSSELAEEFSDSLTQE